MLRSDQATGSPDQSARQRLLDAAAALFTAKGYATASVREIVAAAGVTKPVLYYHFGSKEGIFLALIQESYQALKDLLGTGLGHPGSVRQRLMRLADDIYQLFNDNLGLVRFIHSIYYGPDQGAPEVDLDSFFLVVHQAVTDLAAEGVATGEFRPGDPAEMAWALSGTLNTALEVNLCLPDLAPGRAGLGRLLNFIFDGIAAPGEPGEPGEPGGRN
ncbi:MAG: TetR/AcrR family transcriptional regulator [Pseudomonadota bacterium]